MSDKLNQATTELKPYPAEELNRIKRRLIENDVTVFDFGTGDPTIPVWEPIRQALVEGISEISQYPAVGGTDLLKDAQAGYLKRRYGLEVGEELAVIPTSGSKEAVFHLALSIIGRSNGKKHVIYPDPGYPVYRSSTIFAGGIPYPVRLNPTNNFLLEPWELPSFVQKDAAAVWVNYPHNPTGALAPKGYWERLLEWAKETDTIILSDDCYNDIYLDDTDLPSCVLQYGTEMVVSLMSLSKRSGLTGYRSGLIAGDPDIIKGHLRARANMGVATPTFIQNAAVVAWNDDEHVQERRRIFAERMAKAIPVFQELGMIEEAPEATFYLWTKIPDSFRNNDVKFCTALAEKGIIASPSQWLSEGIKGYARFALVPDTELLDEALEIIKEFVNGKAAASSEPNEDDSSSDEQAEDESGEEETTAEIETEARESDDATAPLTTADEEIETHA